MTLPSRRQNMEAMAFQGCSSEQTYSLAGCEHSTIKSRSTHDAQHNTEANTLTGSSSQKIHSLVGYEQNQSATTDEIRSKPDAFAIESTESKTLQFLSETTSTVREALRSTSALSSALKDDTNSNHLNFSPEKVETRKVSFPSQMTAVIPESILTSTSCFDSGMNWYLQDELTTFRSQARDLCRHMRNFTRMSLCTLSWDNHENRCDTRGLEQRSCLERQKRKFITNRFILKASQKLSADHLADLSCKVTAWAVELAAQEAVRDFYRAYGLDRNLGLKRQLPVPSTDDSRNLKPKSG